MCQRADGYPVRASLGVGPHVGQCHLAAGLQLGALPASARAPDEGDGLPATVANRMLGAVLNLPPTQRALANQQLRSRFVDGVIRRFTGKR